MNRSTLPFLCVAIGSLIPLAASATGAIAADIRSNSANPVTGLASGVSAGVAAREAAEAACRRNGGSDSCKWILEVLPGSCGAIAWGRGMENMVEGRARSEGEARKKAIDACRKQEHPYLQPGRPSDCKVHASICEPPLTKASGSR